MKIGLIADLHCSSLECNIPERHTTQAPERLKAFLAETEECDFLLNLGDLINGCGDIQLDRDALKSVTDAFDAQPLTVYHAIGNHDLAIPKAEFCKALDIPSGDYSFLRDGVRFIILEANFCEDGITNPESWTVSYLGKRRIDWLEATLARDDFKWAVVITHQCLDELSPNGEKDENSLNHVIDDFSSARRVIRECGKVPLVISAHFHQGKMRAIDGTVYFTQPAACIGERVNFGILEIDPETGRLGVEQHGIKVTPTLIQGEANEA